MPGAPWGWGVNARKREREKEGSEKASKQAAKGNLAPVDHGNPLKLTCTGAGSNANTPAGLKPLDVCAHDMTHATNGVASHADARSHDAACTDIEDDTTHDIMHASNTDARSRGYQHEGWRHTMQGFTRSGSSDSHSSHMMQAGTRSDSPSRRTHRVSRRPSM